MTLSYAPGAALVTGGTGGIGSAVVALLSSRGVPVALTYNLRPDAAPAGIPAFPWSTSKADDAARLVADAAEAAGPIRHLVACTGIAQERALFRMDEREVLDIVDTNLIANLALVRAAAAPMMKAGFGRIVLVSSISGTKGMAGHTIYAATKAGLNGFVRALSVECADFGVTVNAVAPGFVETPMTGALPEARRKALVAGIPAKRFGLPAEVASVVGFLLSEQASYVTGQTWAVDGGLSA